MGTDSDSHRRDMSASGAPLKANIFARLKEAALVIAVLYLCVIVSWGEFKIARSDLGGNSSDALTRSLNTPNSGGADKNGKGGVGQPAASGKEEKDKDRRDEPGSAGNPTAPSIPGDQVGGNSDGVKASSESQSPMVPEFVAGQLLIRFKPSAKPENIAKVLATVNPKREVRPGVSNALNDVGGFSAASASSALRGSLILAEVPASNGFAAASMSKGACTNASVKSSRDATITTLTEIRKNPAVDFAEPNYIFRASSDSPAANDPGYLQGLLRGLYGPSPTDLRFPNRISKYGANVDSAWSQGVVGSKNVYVGVIDTGIDIAHPDLASNIFVNKSPLKSASPGDISNDIHGWNFYKGNNNLSPSYSGSNGSADSPHGTHVAGIIGAVGGNGIGVVGVNWNVTIIPVRFLGPDETGTEEGLISALNYLIDLKKREHLRLVAINMSFTSYGNSVFLFQAMKAAANANILLIAAAGNGNTFGIGQSDDQSPVYPASYDTTKVLDKDSMAGSKFNAIVSVAALDDQGNLATFSNFGRSVHLAAPGVGILSTFPNGKYGKLSGTSMAAPFVTGAIALRAAAHQQDTAQDLKRALLKSVASTPSLGNQKTLSGGRLDVAKSVQ